MKTLYPAHPDDFKTYPTDQLRRQYLVDTLFEPDRSHLVYSHSDRIIVGGICPAGSALKLETSKELGSPTFLARREAGIINVGGAGRVTVDGKEYGLDRCDGLYVGMGAVEVLFASVDPDRPAKFYLNSAPAHFGYPTTPVSQKAAKRILLGTSVQANQRVIRQYIHQEGVQSCQLVMGLTVLEPGSIWNTMPCHTHDRRVEIYMYFDLPDDAVVFHFLGHPAETRHIVVRNEQAVLSPAYSIHAGAGTAPYAFVWGMAGENQDFADMDHVPMDTLR